MKMLKLLLLTFLFIVTASASANQATRFTLLHCHCYQNATKLFDAVEQQYGYYFPRNNRVIFYDMVYTDVERTQGVAGGTTPKTTMIYRCYNSYQTCLLTWEDRDFYYKYQGRWYFFDSMANSLEYFGAK